MRGGILAAEKVFRGAEAGDASSKTLSVFSDKDEQSYIKKSFGGAEFSLKKPVVPALGCSEDFFHTRCSRSSAVAG